MQLHCQPCIDWTGCNKSTTTRRQGHIQSHSWQPGQIDIICGRTSHISCRCDGPAGSLGRIHELCNSTEPPFPCHTLLVVHLSLEVSRKPTIFPMQSGFAIGFSSRWHRNFKHAGLEDNIPHTTQFSCCSACTLSQAKIPNRQVTTIIGHDTSSSRTLAQTALLCHGGLAS